MNAEQCEFLAEQQPIDILPNFNEPILHLIGGDFGPFEAGIVARGVPVWLAVYLKKCHKCKILAPSWLTIDELHAMVSAEKATDTFTPVPEHFCELAHILLHAAADDLQETEQLKTLVQDLWDVRVAKMRTSTLKFVQQQKGGGSYARLDHVTRLELTYARPVLTEVIRQKHRLQMAAIQRR